MPTTVLAVDDSVTMRKVLEITFGGEEFSLALADGPQAALSQLGSPPDVAVVDAKLGADDGYALCKEIRAKSPGTAIVLLTSRHQPYDAGKGAASGVDANVDKPFDTQSLIDKAKSAISTRAQGGGAPEPVAAAPAAQPAAPAPAAQPAAPAAPAPAAQPAPPAAAAKPAAPAAAAPAAAARPQISRSATLMFDSKMPPPQVGGAKAAAAPAASAASASIDAGSMAQRLGELGLSKEQIEGVLALSREVVEQVVWEVVPTLAETLIKEEIDRLTRE